MKEEAAKAMEYLAQLQANEQYQNEREAAIALGGGGSFGLVIENNFSSGSSGVSDTFANAQLASTEMFNVLSFEIYGFVDVWS